MYSGNLYSRSVRLNMCLVPSDITTTGARVVADCEPDPRRFQNTILQPGFCCGASADQPRSSTLGAPALVEPSTTNPAEARACTTQHRDVVQHGLDKLEAVVSNSAQRGAAAPHRDARVDSWPCTHHINDGRWHGALIVSQNPSELSACGQCHVSARSALLTPLPLLGRQNRTSSQASLAVNMAVVAHAFA